ncbi:hypothetical protein KKG83_04090 [Candidatus Micrarchaeota archaeon]|nr:hypothetical protein [Candidatus Micrarchaeota archaeon]MBU2476626.1 hypothetical protein [Candidatus Micrarchaeota archaeon]
MTKKVRQIKRSINPLANMPLNIRFVGRRTRIQPVHTAPNESIRNFVAGLTAKQKLISLKDFRRELMNIQPNVSPKMMAFYWRFYRKKLSEK